MRVLKEIDRRSSFHEQQNLSRCLHRSEFRDGLWRTVIQDLEILPLQAFYKFPFGIRHNYADVYAVDIQANRLTGNRGWFLGCGAEIEQRK